MSPVNLDELELGYSYVTQVSVRPGVVELAVDLIMPPARNLVFECKLIRISGFAHVDWDAWLPPAGNADGTFDWGSVDELVLDDGLTVLEGLFGALRLTGGVHVFEMGTADEVS